MDSHTGELWSPIFSRDPVQTRARYVFWVGAPRPYATTYPGEPACVRGAPDRGERPAPARGGISPGDARERVVAPGQV